MKTRASSLGSRFSRHNRKKRTSHSGIRTTGVKGQGDAGGAIDGVRERRGRVIGVEAPVERRTGDGGEGRRGVRYTWRASGCLTSTRFTTLGYGKAPPRSTRAALSRESSRARAPSSTSAKCAAMIATVVREERKKGENGRQAPRRPHERFGRQTECGRMVGRLGSERVARRASNQSPGLPTRRVLSESGGLSEGSRTDGAGWMTGRHAGDEEVSSFPRDLLLTAT